MKTKMLLTEMTDWMNEISYARNQTLTYERRINSILYTMMSANKKNKLSELQDLLLIHRERLAEIHKSVQEYNYLFVTGQLNTIVTERKADYLHQLLQNQVVNEITNFRKFSTHLNKLMNELLFLPNMVA